MSRKRIATAADLRAINRNAGAITMRIPADGGRATVRVPDENRSRRDRRRGSK